MDIIFWGKSYDKFLAEAFEKSPKLVTRDVANNYKLLYNATPPVFNKRGEFMILVRPSDGTVGQFARCQSIDNLGGYVAVLQVAAKREIYDRIYPNAPYDIMTEDGKITITPPEKFGVFAGDE